MAKGKFESSASTSRRAKSAPKAARQPARRKSGGKVLPILLAVLGAVVVLGGAALLLNEFGVVHLFGPAEDGADDGRIAEGVIVAGVDLSNMTEKEAVAALEAVADQYGTDMKLTLTQTVTDGQKYVFEPIEITFPASEANISLNPQRAYSEAYRVGREIARPTDGSNYVVPADRYLSIDTNGIQSRLDEVCKTLKAGQELDELAYRTVTEKRDVEVEQEDGSMKTERRDVKVLQVRNGTAAADFRKEDVYNLLMEGYATGVFTQELKYTIQEPKPLDTDKIFEAYCTEPQDAYYDTRKHEIVDGVVGYGFDREELLALLDEAEEGEIVSIDLRELEPEITRETLEDSLFSDILGSASTPCTANWNRTRNLELACEAINGTVLQPGEVFSFNGTVGMRTEAKGYLPATAYVTGGASQDEIGGGVCQVASSIYYSALLADLKIVERTEHMYAVTYVPMGMDATVYFGSLDFKFENNTDYPLRIDANVSGGYVNIALVGTDTHDYTVNMTYEVLATIPWEEVEVETDEVPPGTVVTTAYTGYRVVTYKHKLSKATGAEISVEKVADSNYQKRDREIAIPVAGTEPETEPIYEVPQEDFPNLPPETSGETPLNPDDDVWP